jgi:beta-glucosidase
LATIFSKSFLWGAGVSAHQVEGGNHNQWTVWELENARALAVQAEYHLKDLPSWDRIKRAATSPSNYVSHKATDHLRRFDDDFDLLERMNMNCLRFSIEWSRVEPREGEWDSEAILHYKNYVANLKDRNIEPMATLFHMTLPVWFAQKGGFEKRSNVKYYNRFVKKIVGELGLGVKYYITVNEPEIYAWQSYYAQEWPPARRSFWKMVRVIHNLMYAHRSASKIIHGMSRYHKVSIAKNSTYIYPGDTAWLSHWSAHILQYFTDDYILKRVVKSCDFIGVNYYVSQRVYGYMIHNPDNHLSDMGWTLSPGDIEFVLERLHTKYQKPVIITENGLADALDQDRKWWIQETLVGIQNAIKRGVKVQGYIHWSLTDNFEWSSGRWPRFGLAEVDYRTGERKLRPSAIWFGRIIKKLRG